VPDEARSVVENRVAQGGEYRFSGEPVALVITVFDSLALRDALKRRDAVIILGTPELECQFRWLEFWQSKQTTFLIVATVLGMLSAYSISRGYRFEASLLHDWKLERTEGKLTLTPVK
jgi:hypothetical protein